MERCRSRSFLFYDGLKATPQIDRTAYTERMTMKNIRDYCVPNFILPVIVSLMLILVGVIFNIAMADLGNEIERALALVMTIATNCVGIPFVSFSMYGTARIRFEKRLKACTMSISEDMIETDFERSSAFFKDKIRVGEYCIYGNGTGVFALFDEIRSISIHRGDDTTAGISVTWEVQLNTVSERLTLYKLKRCSTSEWQAFVEYMETLAPNISIEKMTFSSTKIGTGFQPYPGNPYYRQ